MAFRGDKLFGGSMVIVPRGDGYAFQIIVERAEAGAATGTSKPN